MQLQDMCAEESRISGENRSTWMWQTYRSTGILAGLGALFGALLTFGQEVLRMRHDLSSALG